MGCQLGTEKDGGWAVGTADNSDRSRFFGQEAQAQGAEQGKENAHLRRGAQQHQYGACQQRRKIGHGSEAQKDYRWVQAGGDAEIKIVQDTVAFVNAKSKSLKEGDITDQNPKTNRHQQKRLIFFGRSQVQKGSSDQDHDELAIVNQIITGVG